MSDGWNRMYLRWSEVETCWKILKSVFDIIEVISLFPPADGSIHQLSPQSDSRGVPPTSLIFYKRWEFREQLLVHRISPGLPPPPLPRPPRPPRPVQIIHLKVILSLESQIRLWWCWWRTRLGAAAGEEEKQTGSQSSGSKRVLV